MTDDATQVSVSREVRAPASEIFALLATPCRHVDIDGSSMLRGTDDDRTLAGVGDEFLMRMYHEQSGDYVMKNAVVEFEADRRIAWEPERFDVQDDEHRHHRWGFTLAPSGAGATQVTEFHDCSRSPAHARQVIKNGAVWREATERTLERLDELFAAQPED